MIIGKLVEIIAGEYHGCGEEYNMENRKRGSKMIFPVILWLLRKSGKGDRRLGEKIRIKKLVGEEYKVAGNFLHL